LRTGELRCVALLGYHIPGDGGGGHFFWDASSAEPDNGGIIITPASNPATGRWKRLADGPLSVKWFGANGNGLAYDRSAVQNAINAAASANEGVIDVFFPVGRHLLIVCGDWRRQPRGCGGMAEVARHNAGDAAVMAL
jgi:hypothetical protein